MFLLSFAHAETPVRLLHQYLGKIQSFQAHFHETVVNERGDLLRETEGQLAWQRPGKFRWHTQTPTQQLIVADSQNLWIYDIDLAQLTIKAQKAALRGAPAFFLSADMQTLDREFDVRLLQNNPNEKIFQLQPTAKKNNSFSSMIWVFNREGLVAIELADQLGQTTTIRLDHTKTNPVLSAQIFRLTYPDNVDVIDQR
jgi:outer membrane lipoprotein carrier protein